MGANVLKATLVSRCHFRPAKRTIELMGLRTDRASNGKLRLRLKGFCGSLAHGIYLGYRTPKSRHGQLTPVKTRFLLTSIT